MQPEGKRLKTEPVTHTMRAEFGKYIVSLHFSSDLYLVGKYPKMLEVPLVI